MDAVKSEKDEKKPGIYFRNKTRIVVLLICMVCLMCGQANSLTMNFTVICMDDVIIEQKSQMPPNSTHWLENSKDISLLFSSIAIGSIVGTLPLVPLLNRLGVRYTITAYIFISGVGTVIIPACVHMGFYAVLFARFLQGIGVSALFSSMGAISERWSVLAELSTYLAILSSSFQISAIVTMPLAGILCESTLGWQMLYYSLGVFTLFAVTVFFCFYTDDPEIHRNVSQKELRKISFGKAPRSKAGVPYRAICKDKVVLGIWSSVIGGNMGFMLLLYYGPTYLNKVLHLNVQETGFGTALPYVLCAAVKFSAGPISDCTTCVSERIRVIIFAAVSQGALAAGFLIMALTSSTFIAQVAYTGSIVLAGLNIVGIIKCAQMVTRQYVHFVMAVISFTACLNTFILPIIVGIVCPDNSPEQWSRLYIGISIITIVSNLPFPFYATVQPAEYTKPSWSEKKQNQVQPVDVEA